MTQDRKRTERRRLVVAVALAVALAAGVFAGCSAKAGATEARLEAAASPGTDPFMESVAITSVTEFPTVVREVAQPLLDGLGAAEDGTRSVDGTEPGLYGGSNQQGVCDRAQLVAYLAEDEEKAQAWAAVFDIPVESIETFVGGLTPVVLLTDTLVTNHGFRDGAATPFPSVLEAGTAVLVDARGVPRVRCGCGNPLAPPPVGDDLAYVGDAWDGFAAEDVVAVGDGGSPADELEVVDLDTGEPGTIPVAPPIGQAPGESGGDQGWVMTYSPEEFDVDALKIATSSDGVEWTDIGTVPDFLHSLAEGPDGWVGVGRATGTTTTVYASDDLRTWTPVGAIHGVEDERCCIHLAYGEGRFVAVKPSHRGLVETSDAFWSTDGVTWTQVDLPVPFSLRAGFDEFTVTDLAHSEEDGFVGGYEHGFYVDDRYVVEAGLVSSDDGMSWTVGHAAQGDTRIGGIAAGNDVIVQGLLRADTPLDDPLRDGSVGIRDGVADPIEVVSGTPFLDRPMTAVRFGGGRFLAFGAESFNEGSGSGEAGVFTSEDGRSWTHVSEVQAYVAALAYGTISSGDTVAPSEPSGDGVDLQSVDWENRAYEACAGIVDPGPLELQDGGFQSPDGFGGAELDSVSFGDADGDGTDDALVEITCSAGTAAGTSTELLVFTAGPDGPVQLGDPFLANYTASGAIVDGTVQVTQDRFLDGDPACCPSGGTETVTWTFEDGRWVSS